MNYTADQIYKALQCTAASEPLPRPDAVISILLTDSRSLTDAPASLFFAIETATGDGHRYLDDLYAAGVRNFVVNAGKEVMLPADANVMRVPDVMQALHRLAAAHRRSLGNVAVTAITGSRGKTMVKEWLYALLRDDFRIARSPRSFNSQIGVPLSLWEMDSDTELGIFEAGVSREGEMAGLAAMIAPQTVIITNIGREHDEGFPSRKAKAIEKLRLAADADTLIYNGDDPLLAEAVAEAGLKASAIAWSRTRPDSRLFVSSVRRAANDATDIEYTFDGKHGRTTIPFCGEAEIEDAIHCLAAMLHLGVTPDVIAARMAALTPVGTRLEVSEGSGGCLLVADSYTSDLHSLSPALDFIRRRATAGRSLTVILSDMMHETTGPDKLYADVARLLRLNGVTRIIGIGSEISAHSGAFGPEASFYTSTEEFLAATSADDFHREMILIKGAPRFRFDKIVERLEGRLHETVLEVNLDALTRNYNYFRSRLKPATGIVCMVKAFGYGAGSYELAKTLQSCGAAYLAVAAHDEGVDLRRAGITMPIMVLNPKIAVYGPLFDYRLEPEIYSLDVLGRIIAEAEHRGEKNYPVHIKLDTGMHRLGFLEEELPALADMLARQHAVSPASIFSHLCCADDPLEDDYTRGQIEYFNRCCDYFQSRFPHHIKRHILNSAGILRFPAHQNDMVRLGIGLYGIRILGNELDAGLERVSSLHTVIISIRDWPAGTTVGYNRRGVLDRPSRIATLPVGYADGLDRHLGYGKLKVYVNGCLCPTVGSLCMDVMMIDVTDVDCRVGDRVEIFGNSVPTEGVAELQGTIPYEILTSVATRVKRVYYRE